MAALPKMVWSCIVTDDTTTALCLAHCSVTFFFPVGQKQRGSVLRLKGGRCRSQAAKTHSKKRLQQYEGGGRAPRPFAFAEATALASRS